MERTNDSGWASFILGIISSLAWLIPLIGLPITVVGTALGAIGIGNPRDRGFSIAGMIMNIVFLGAAITKGVMECIFYYKKLRQKSMY